MQKLKSFTINFVFVIAALGLTISSARPAILTVDGGGVLTGATGVDLGSLGFFNVEFFDDNCFTIFTGCDAVSDFDFATSADAITAGNALLGQVFVDDDPSQPFFLFDTLLSLTFGCSGGGLCQTIIPYALADGDFRLVQAVNNAPNEIDDFVFSASIRFQETTTIAPTVNFATFTPVSPVPLPPAALLFVTALIGLLAFARRQRQA